MKRMVPEMKPVAVPPQAAGPESNQRGIHLVYRRDCHAGGPLNTSHGLRHATHGGLSKVAAGALSEALPGRRELAASRTARRYQPANRSHLPLALAASAAPAVYLLHVLLAWLRQR